FTSDFSELEPFLEKALISEINNDEDHDRGLIAAGIAKSGRLLAKGYVWHITNVPYLSVSKHSDTLLELGQRSYQSSRHDLATIFLVKLVNSLKSKGTVSVVIPQNWQFLPRYKHLRKSLLKNETWNFIARLGPKAFQT